MSALFWFGYVILQIPSGLVLQYVTAELVSIVSGLLFAISAFLFAIPTNSNTIVLPTIIMILSGIASAPLLLATFKLLAQNMGSNAVPYYGGAIIFFAVTVRASGYFLQAYLWQHHEKWREMYVGCSTLTFLAFLFMYSMSFIKFQGNMCTPDIEDITDIEPKPEGKVSGKMDTATTYSPSSKEVGPVSIERIASHSTSAMPTIEIPKESEPSNAIYCCKILVTRPADCKTPGNVTRKSPTESMKLAFSNPWNYIIGLHWFSVVSIFIVLNGLWLISYMSLKFGYSREVSTLINNASLGANAVGNIILGKLSTKYKRRKMVYIISSIGMLSPLYVLYCGPDAHIVIVTSCIVIFGFCSAVGSMEFGIAREYNDFYGCSDIAGGIVNSLALFLGGTVLTWIMGNLMDVSWTERGGEYDHEKGDRIYTVDDYDSAFMLIPAVLALNWMITLMIKETKGEMIEWDQKKSFCSRYFGNDS